MSKPVLTLLAKARRKLNLVIMGTEAMRAVFWSAIVAIPVAIASPWIGLKSYGFAIWAYVVLIGALIGCGMGWFRRLDLYGTAKWLDGKLGDGDIFTAALVCMRRELSGPYDGKILAHAEKIALGAKGSPPPLRAFGGRSALAAVSSLVFAGFILFWNPRNGEGVAYPLLESSSQGANSGKVNSVQNDSAELRKSPESIAKALFPQDDKAAKRAEKAIREGDDESLRKLLADEGADYQDEMDVRSMTDDSEDEEDQDGRNGSSQGTENRRDSASGRGGEEGSSGSYGQGEEQSLESFYRENPGYGENSANASMMEKGGNGQSPAGGLGDQNSSGDSEGEGAATGISGTSGWGTGEGYRVNRGDIESRAGSEELLLQKKGSDRFVQMVLPERKVDRPSSSSIAASGRVAEAAMARKGVPVEYEEFVKSYFEALAGAESGGIE